MKGCPVIRPWVQSPALKEIKRKKKKKKRM
jgi:hypothetical protein